MPNSYYFPTGYQPYQQTTNQTSNSIVWVQGEAGAKAYPVSPNTSLLLMDSESSVFYIKTTDASGMPMPLRVFDYTERSQNVSEQSQVANIIDENKFITRQEFEERLSELKPKTKKKVIEVEEDE